MVKASLGVVLAALMLGGCVFEQSASREAQEGGSPGRLAPPPRPAARAPTQAALPPQPDRVRAEDLSRLSPGTGNAGPEAEPAPLTRRTPYPSRIHVQAASFVTRAQAESARRSIAGLGPSGV